MRTIWTPQARALATLGLGVWVVGFFALLVYGIETGHWAGFVAFTVTIVLGASCLAWILRKLRR